MLPAHSSVVCERHTERDRASIRGVKGVSCKTSVRNARPIFERSRCQSVKPPGSAQRHCRNPARAVIFTPFYNHLACSGSAFSSKLGYCHALGERLIKRRRHRCVPARQIGQLYMNRGRTLSQTRRLDLIGSLRSHIIARSHPSCKRPRYQIEDQPVRRPFGLVEAVLVLVHPLALNGIKGVLPCGSSKCNQAAFAFQETVDG